MLKVDGYQSKLVSAHCNKIKGSFLSKVVICNNYEVVEITNSISNQTSLLLLWLYQCFSQPRVTFLLYEQ